MTTASNFSLPRLGLIDLVCASPTFRSIVGATDSATAALHVYSPYADDRPDEDAGIDTITGDPPPLSPRPRCEINPGNKYNRRRMGTAFGGTKGNLFISFEFPPGDFGGDRDKELEFFMEQVGQIFDEMEQRSGQDKGAGEAVRTSPNVTFLNWDDLDLIDGPGESIARDENGKLFYGVMFEITYIG